MKTIAVVCDNYAQFRNWIRYHIIPVTDVHDAQKVRGTELDDIIFINEYIKDPELIVEVSSRLGRKWND